MSKAVEKPKLKSPGSPPKPPASPSKSSPNHGKKVITTKGSGHGGGKKGGGGGHGGGGHGNNQPPSPWLGLDSKDQPVPHKTASFVEYLRWMRELNRNPAQNDKDPTDPTTKVQILQMAMENAKYYDDRLKICNKRTQAIAGEKNTFQVTCPWRIRVGGHRGPESILLPAFDSLGMPYIPSATLRGVARTQAIREVMQSTGKNWKDAEKDPLIVKHFGALDADKADQAGKVVFLDAYPTSGKCLTVDMANNIWSWDGKHLNYSPNPNPFLSLKEPTFLIGLRLVSNCSDPQILTQVKKWLIAGLASGAGSQINTGYGQLLENPKQSPNKPFLEVEFALEGQLIHGYQKPGQWNREKGRFNNGINQAEVRPTAFKSMLRYWFRVFALGVLSPNQVQDLEGKIFGAISPTQSHGLLRVNILNGRVTQKEAQNKNDDAGEIAGILTLSFSPEAPPDTQDFQNLLKNLTWLMFNLGGIGQGARRPCYSRSNRKYAPWWRGSTFILESDPWNDPEESTAQEFAKLFKRRLREFYDSLGAISSVMINANQLQSTGRVNQQNWQDAADTNCKIVIVSGSESHGKCFALAQLHSDQFKVQRGGKLDYDGNLCGQVRGGVKPSPVWIADVGEDYQVVTIFGATASPRLDYLRSLKGAIQVFPLS
ncbi:RAMP superfamily CRISPR-associated protein [Synechocystis sp. PCC 7338]|uniref:RAMP superfamily CRISPR-associated protein n=1 Tax=Synechocystis sp. PCC 7338 TaxID=2732530 RepID=UPI001BAF51F4|nr:RAMP superfamily CRISPR-associated protein [Synechocystis sp. PCC 7338]QUS62543.1 type III-B CRISPR module RAMP protein Cmr6 [Synechocystis sp. PCC 7338]